MSHEMPKPAAWIPFALAFFGGSFPGGQSATAGCPKDPLLGGCWMA